MTEIFWLVCGLVLLLAFFLVRSLLDYQAGGYDSFVGWVLRHIADSNFDAHAASLECYGEYLGLQAGTRGSGFDETPTTEGLLHGVFVVVTCSTALDVTIVTGVAHHLPGTALVQRRLAAPALLQHPDAQPGIDDRFAREFASESEPPDAPPWLTPALRQLLLTMPLPDVSLALSRGRFVLTLGGLHASDVAVLDHALAIVLTAVLGEPSTPVSSRMSSSADGQPVHGPLRPSPKIPLL